MPPAAHPTLLYNSSSYESALLPHTYVLPSALDGYIDVCALRPAYLSPTRTTYYAPISKQSQRTPPPLPLSHGLHRR